MLTDCQSSQRPSPEYIVEGNRPTSCTVSPANRKSVSLATARPQSCCMGKDVVYCNLQIHIDMECLAPFVPPSEFNAHVDSIYGYIPTPYM